MDRSAIIQCNVYIHRVLTITTRLDVMNRLGRAMADPTRSRILMTLLDGPIYPAALARELDLSPSNVSNHLTCLRDCGIIIAEPEGRRTRYEVADPRLTRALTALLETTLAVDHAAVCIESKCTVPGCCTTEVDA
jgi:DNA-binding transcriptional ArsR family regulator